MYRESGSPWISLVSLSDYKSTCLGEPVHVLPSALADWDFIRTGDSHHRQCNDRCMFAAEYDLDFPCHWLAAGSCFKIPDFP